MMKQKMKNLNDQMGKFSHYQQCPKCLESGRDSRGDNCGVYSDGSLHCFSCGFHKFPKHFVPSSNEKEKVNESVLPSDFTREVPSHALKWLLQYGLPWSYWKPFIGWTEKDMRLVFTVGTGPSFSVGRFIPGEDGRSQRKWYVWGESHRQAHVIGNPFDAKQIVLVEDLISAHKLGRVVPTICLFGTNIFDAVIPVLRHLQLPITLWLDKDQEGHVERKCLRLSLLTQLPVKYIFTKEDPKMQTFDKIKELLP